MAPRGRIFLISASFPVLFEYFHF